MKTVSDWKPLSDTPPVQETPDREPTSLYVCESCHITYIDTELRSCPKCGDAVDQTPSASELGYGSDD